MIILFFQVLYFLEKLVFHHLYKQDIADSENLNEKDCKVDDNNKDKVNCNLSMQLGGLKRRYSGDDDSYEESKAAVRFSPPAFIQRYQAVQKVLADPPYSGKLKKIVDFGCSELGFFCYLKHMPGVEELLFVDIDRHVLETYKEKVKPLHVDYLHTRQNPLSLKILEGSVSEPDKVLENCDAVICIELVEHLYPDTLAKLPCNIFGFIRPKVAIITTPNADFNVLFKNMSKFRHPDHKFEWTRAQFQEWANNIVSRFPEYSVSFHGICNGPSGFEDLGCCTQMAVFHKINDVITTVPSVEGLYKIVAEIDYPFKVDNRSDEEKILDDAVYFIRKFSLNQEEITEEILLEHILKAMSNFCISLDDLKKILENGNWTIVNRENGPVVLVPPVSPFSSHSMDSEFSDQALTDYSEWDDEPQFATNYDLSNQNSDVELSNEYWESEPFIESVNHSSENNGVNTNVANSTPSMHQDDVCLDDIPIASCSIDPANSLINESIVSCNFPKTIDSENSENPKSSCSQAQMSLILADSKLTEDSTSFFSTQSLEESKLNNSENNSLDKNSSICSMFLEPSKMSEGVDVENLNSLLETTVTSPSVHEIFKSFVLSNEISSNTTKEINFKDPKYTSSPHVSLLNCEKKKINKQFVECIDTEPINKFNNDLLLPSNNNLKDSSKITDNNASEPHTFSNDPLIESNHSNRNLLEKNDFENPEELRNNDHVMFKNRSENILETNTITHKETKLEVSNTSKSLPNCFSPEIIDSGVSNSNSIPDVTPLCDISSVAQDNTLDLESSISDGPKYDNIRLAYIQTRDFADNNLDDGNNMEVENN